MKTEHPIYLDYNATTPVDPVVFEAMSPWFQRSFGNASSTHFWGRHAANAIEESRERVAASLGTSPPSVFFTSGATEANNLALRGMEGHIAVVSTEHKSVLETSARLNGSVIQVDRKGNVDLTSLDRESKRAALVSVMLANNETGVVQDLEAIIEIAHRHGCLVHTDATQAFGKIAFNLFDLDVDMASISGHKIYGPQGVGALIVKRGVSISPQMTGGGHERGLRSGTLNVPGIVGFGAATTTIDSERDSAHSRSLLDSLVGKLGNAMPFEIYSNHQLGLANTLSIRFAGTDAEAVIANAPDIAISTGSACTAAVPQASHVLEAMGISTQAAFETLRISVGRQTTHEEISFAAMLLSQAVQTVRNFAIEPLHIRDDLQ